MAGDDYYVLDPGIRAWIRKERERARKLRKSRWWRARLDRGVCHYCERRFPPSRLTMDHIVPLARGGRSVPGNVVPACLECNRSKRLETPAERMLKRIRGEEADR